MYDSLLAYFMTGTGNSYRIAGWCTEVAEGFGLNSKLIHVKTGVKAHFLTESVLYVFTYPTHGFTAPLLMLNFVWRLPRGKNKHAIILPSRAGVRVKGLFIPGLEGTAGYLVALLLWIKGYSIRGVMGIDMPSNWTALHWGMSEENVGVITSLAENKVKNMVGLTLGGKRHYDGVVQLFIGLLLVKVSCMYLIVAQFILAKLFFASDKCNGCSLCTSICPKEAIKMVGKPKRPYWTYSCDSCMACMNFCPNRAIEVSPVIVTLFYYITTIPAAAFLLRALSERIGLELASMTLFGFAIQYVYIILAVALSYWLLHLLFSSRLIRKIAGILSHTRYFRRYKAKGVSPKDNYHRL